MSMPVVVSHLTKSKGEKKKKKRKKERAIEIGVHREQTEVLKGISGVAFDKHTVREVRMSGSCWVVWEDCHGER